MEKPNHTPTIAHTKDGRWLMAYNLGARDRAALAPFLDRYGMAADLQVGNGTVDPAADQQARSIPGSGATGEGEAHRADVIQRFVRAFRYDSLPWREAQEAGLLWSPLRKPHESEEDEHWLARGSFRDLEHPQLSRTLRYPVSKWLSTETCWQSGRPAPRIGADTDAVLTEWSVASPSPVPARASIGVERLPPHGKPFALQGIRVLDLSWFLASAGGTKFMNALGAESIKIDWKANPDTRLAAMSAVARRAKLLQARWKVSTTQRWAGSSTTRTRASVGCLLTCATRAGSTSPSAAVAMRHRCRRFFTRRSGQAGAGIMNRGAPGYGEDNWAILSEYLGLTEAEIAHLASEDVI